MLIPFKYEFYLSKKNLETEEDFVISKDLKTFRESKPIAKKCVLYQVAIQNV